LQTYRLQLWAAGVQVAACVFVAQCEGASAQAMRPQSQDPFDVARFEVDATIKKVQFMHKEWKRLLDQQNTSESQQFKDLHAEISGELQMLDYDIQEVARSIQMVEQNRDKFRLSDTELSARQAFVKKCQEGLQEVQSDLSSRRASSKMEEDRRQSLLSHRQKEQDEQQRRSAMDAEGYYAQEQMLQRQLIGQQEDELVELSKATLRVGQVALTINGELQTHVKMLEELNEDIDEQTHRMGILMKGVSSVLKTSNKCQTFGLIGLIVLFVVEVWLMFNT